MVCLHCEGNKTGNSPICLFDVCLPVHVPIPVILLNRSIFFLLPVLHPSSTGKCRRPVILIWTANQPLLWKFTLSALIPCSTTFFRHSPFGLAVSLRPNSKTQTQSEPSDTLVLSSLRTTILKLQHKVPFFGQSGCHYHNWNLSLTNHWQTARYRNHTWIGGAWGLPVGRLSYYTSSSSQLKIKTNETNRSVGWKQSLDIWLKQERCDSRKTTEKYWKSNYCKGVSDSTKG